MFRPRTTEMQLRVQLLDHQAKFTLARRISTALYYLLVFLLCGQGSEEQHRGGRGGGGRGGGGVALHKAGEHQEE